MAQRSLLLRVSLLISPTQVSWWLPCNMKHDTSSIILYMRRAISACSIWPPLSPDTQIPFLRPGAVFFCFCGNHYSSSSEERGDDEQPVLTFRLTILTGDSTIERNLPRLGPIANSCKLFGGGWISRRRLRAMKARKTTEKATLRKKAGASRRKAATNTSWILSDPTHCTWLYMRTGLTVHEYLLAASIEK